MEGDASWIPTINSEKQTNRKNHGVSSSVAAIDSS